MQLRSIAGGVLGLTGLTLGANRALANRAEPLGVPFGTERTYRWRGFDVSYAEAGDPADPDMLLIHGVNAAGSKQEFERVADRLAETYHVVAPDLPGFGRSDRPPVTYSGTLYERFVADFASDVTDRPICLGSSLGGAYAVAASAAGTEFAEFILVCPTATAMSGERVWLRSLLRSPGVGEGLFNLLSSYPSLRYFESDHGLYDRASVGQAYLDYKWQTTHQPGARFAPASFVSGFLDATVDLGTTLEAFDGSVTLIWGGETDITPVEQGRELAERIDARLVVIDDSLLLPHVEHPESFLEAVADRLGTEAGTEARVD
jgi:pimeloyl-ACP methyl ester carboxylesterase